MKERRAIVVHGTVQGVGFRPFVHGLAARLELSGFVRNQAGSVLIEVEGEPSLLDAFLLELAGKPPPLARIDRLLWEPRAPRGEVRFRIASSQSEAAGDVFIAPDIATCNDCRAELFEPADRRQRYPFINCTNCGPRLTIVTAAPYDRERTTMASFALCPACRAEYECPHNRRFHAQPIACPVCGPRLELLDEQGRHVDTADPLGGFSAALREGGIGAMKGLGGYHLVCDARSEAAVGALRQRKQRDEKPFALMVRDIEAAASICAIDSAEHTLLCGPARPVVLLRRRPACCIASGVAPGNPYLGVMLPYTPLHHLLLDALGDVPLVMTSGNRSDEPIAYEDADAVRRLSGIADRFLIHNRPIHVRCDDSVTRIVAGQELPLRRSRGYAPQPIALPFECRCPVLAVGGQFKGTFALGRGRHAFLSHHLGDLDHLAAYRALTRDIGLYQQLFSLRPEIVAHDLHPDYGSTRCAREYLSSSARLIPVQHHHAHMASCMAEHGLTEPAIGVTFDGTGYGLDGAVWGGEFLVGAYRQFRRAAHLRYVGMPGGDRAVREPWRMAVAHLWEAGCSAGGLAARLPAGALAVVHRMLQRGLNTPPTSSAGRLFDAVAALAGIRQRISYEGQAALELEWLADGIAPDGAYPFELIEPAAPDDALVVDTRPLIRAVVHDTECDTAAAIIARRFHTTMVELIAAVCRRIRDATGLDSVVLSGGVFMNVLLAAETAARLRGDGLRVYSQRQVPPNDGGLSLGQLAVASAQ